MYVERVEVDVKGTCRQNFTVWNNVDGTVPLAPKNWLTKLLGFLSSPIEVHRHPGMNTSSCSPVAESY